MRNASSRRRVTSVLIALSLLALLPRLGIDAAAGTFGQEGSGGRAVAHHAGGKRITTPAVVAKAPDALLYPTGMKSAEPTLGLTKDGDVFFSAFQTNARVEVLRSADEGKTWDIVSPQFAEGRNAQLISLDPYVYVDEWTNRIYTIDLTVACSYLSYADENLDNWTTNPLACGRPVNDHQTLFSGPPVSSPTLGYDNIVYYCWNDVASSSCSKSLDGGLTFAPTGAPAFHFDPTHEDTGFFDVPGFCGGLHGHGIVDNEGVVYLPRENCRQPWLAISRDEGRTWERVQVAKNGTHGLGGGSANPSIAADKEGNAYYTWIAKDRLPYLAVSKDGGKSWSKPMMIGAPGVKEANFATIDVGAPGKIAVVYMGSENSPGEPFPDPECPDDPLSLAPCADPEYEKVTWNGYMMISTNALDADPIFYTSTVNDKDDPIKMRRCGPGRCGSQIYDFIDVEIGADGTLWGAFVDACGLPCAQMRSGDVGNIGIVGRLVGGPPLR